MKNLTMTVLTGMVLALSIALGITLQERNGWRDAAKETLEVCELALEAGRLLGAQGQ